MSISQKFYTGNQKGKKSTILITLIVTFLLSLLSIAKGAVNISVPDMLRAIFTEDALSKNNQILLFVRLPRVLSAILAGSALAVSGTILQCVLDNSLVSPNIIGINTGSGLFALLSMLLFPNTFYMTPIFAFAGGLITALCVYFIGCKTGNSKVTILLSGIAISSILSAISDTLITLFPDVQFARTSFLIGGLSGVTMKSIKFTVGYIVSGIIIAAILGYDLNVLSLGDQTAVSLGQKNNRTRFIYISIAALLASSAVSMVGLIGFVGLIVPHITRILIGSDNRYAIPMSAILGAAFLLFCDTLSRVLFAPYELPVGIILSFLGAPFFLYLLTKHKNRGME